MDYKKLDTYTKTLSLIEAFISAITGVGTSLLVLFGEIEKWMQSQFFQGVFVTLCLGLSLCTFFLIRNLKKYKLIRNALEDQKNVLTEDVGLLRKNICSGLEFLSNDVTIKFIKGRKEEDNKYKLTFHKKCRVIGECKWYSGQVYFNNQLLDEKASEQYYLENQISWEALNATARIRTYSQDGTSNNHDADIYAVAKSPRYFQFHIRFGTSGARINPADYESFEIIYSYEVPITHWGSYINRTISYFGEPAKVTIDFSFSDINITKARQQNDFAQRFINQISVYEKKLDQDPILLGSDAYSCKRAEQNGTELNGIIEIELPEAKAQKYIVSWDPSLYFGKDCLKTEIKKDSAELTAQ